MPTTLPHEPGHEDLARAAEAPDGPRQQPLPAFRPPRRRWAGLAAMALVVAAAAAVGVASWNDRVEPSAAAPEGVSTSGTASGRTEDEAIAARVMQQIEADPALAALQVELRAADGIVTLVGDVPDSATRERLAAIAAMQSGVRGVVNQLNVGER